MLLARTAAGKFWKRAFPSVQANRRHQQQAARKIRFSHFAVLSLSAFLV
jgi:hypothetical protein